MKIGTCDVCQTNGVELSFTTVTGIETWYCGYCGLSPLERHEAKAVAAQAARHSRMFTDLIDKMVKP